MSNQIIYRDDFDTTKSGMLIIAFIVSILFLLANILIGLLAISITVTLLTLKVGIEIDKTNCKYRYFKSFYGKKSGKWLNLEKFKVLTILKKNLKGQVLSPKLVTALNYKQVVFEVNLTTESHRAKVALKRFKTLDLANKFAKSLSKELAFPLENYNPIVSEKTRMRRASRRR
jgi:hypothetical protein